MNLPSLPKTQRTYEHRIWPHKIKYTAFTAGQQSLLLQVADPDTPFQDRLDTLSQIFNQTVTAGAPFEKLPSVVVEKIMVLMREISIGDIMKLKYGCEANFEDGKCNQELIVPINLKEVDIKIDEDFKTDFELAEGYGIRMQLPTYGKITKLNDDSKLEYLIANFTECIYNEEEAFPVADPEEAGISLEEKSKRLADFDEFVKWVADNIDIVKINEIREGFFGRLPSLHYQVKIKCPKCGKEHHIEFNSLTQFFI